MTILRKSSGDNWSRNELLIDLDNVPSDIEAEILKEYQGNVETSNPKKIYEYMLTHGLSRLLADIGDF